MGEEFCEVTCYGNRKVAPYRAADDMQTALFKTPSGAIGRVTAFYSVCRKSSRHNSVYGTDGSLEFRWHDGKLWYAQDSHSDMTIIDIPDIELSEDQKSRIGHGGTDDEPSAAANTDAKVVLEGSLEKCPPIQP